MKTFKVTLVFEDSSTMSNLVQADTEELALNSLINETNTVKNPKFVFFEEAVIVQHTNHLPLVEDFTRLCLNSGDIIYTFKNKLSEIVQVGGVSICLGHIPTYIDLLKNTVKEI